MLNLDRTFVGTRAVQQALADSSAVYRYCTFADAELEGAHCDGVFVACTFEHIDLYWGLFNTAIFVDCTCENCTFRGTSFAGCRFLRDNPGTVRPVLKDALRSKKSFAKAPAAAKVRSLARLATQAMAF